MCQRLQHLQNLRNIFLKSVDSVKPHNLLSPKNDFNLMPTPQKDSNKLSIKLQGKLVDITGKRCHAVGFGKAVLGMAVQLEKSLGDRLQSGILSIPKGSRQQFANIPDMCLKANTVFKVFEGAENNQPDDIALMAAQEIKHLAESLSQNDILFVLISGGGSALLPLPKAPLTLKDKMELIKELSNRGATIQEMNQVRIALSDIKGGQLSALASASTVISFVISDIVGDPVDLIASGPTCYPKERQTNVEEILRKYQLWNETKEHIKILIRKVEEEQQKCLPNNFLYVIGNNQIATSTAEAEAMLCNYIPFVASTTIQGDINELCVVYCNFLKAIYDFQAGLIEENELRQKFPYEAELYQHFLDTLLRCQKTRLPLLLITAGEPTVKVSGTGLGGRNQELALRLSMEFYCQEALKDVFFLSAGTDGIDGPTTAAGALACADIVKDFLLQKPNDLKSLQTFVENNDSFNFFKQLKQSAYHVITGHTGTNVMDLHLFLLL